MRTLILIVTVALYGCAQPPPLPYIPDPEPRPDGMVQVCPHAPSSKDCYLITRAAYFGYRHYPGLPEQEDSDCTQAKQYLADLERAGDNTSAEYQEAFYNVAKKCGPQ